MHADRSHVITFEHHAGSARIAVRCRCGLQLFTASEAGAGAWTRRHRIVVGWAGVR